MKKVFLSCVLAAGSLVGCRGQISSEPPVHLIRNMFTQRRYDPMEANSFFRDGRAMRPFPEGTVSRENANEDDAFYRGGEPVTMTYKTPPQKKPDGVTYVRNPVDITPELMAEGQRGFATYCTPCHGPLGNGKGMVARHGFIGIADLHQERIVKMPDGEIFSTITNGLRNMPSYASQIDEHDRWAIIAYVRALQRSQHTTIDDVPADKRSALGTAPAEAPPATPAKNGNDKASDATAKTDLPAGNKTGMEKNDAQKAMEKAGKEAAGGKPPPPAKTQVKK